MTAWGVKEPTAEGETGARDFWDCSQEESSRRAAAAWKAEKRRHRYLQRYEHKERRRLQRPRPVRPRRPGQGTRPRTSHAPRRVSPSRGDPEPAGESEPPPPPQGRGEDVARSLRTLTAAGPSTGAFAATFGHLPADQQLVAFSMLEPAWEAGCWADLARATEREADRPQGALRGAGGRLRSLLIRARLARPDDPWEPHEWPLGLWRLRRMRCHWYEWREGLRVWSWSERRWEVHG